MSKVRIKWNTLLAFGLILGLLIPGRSMAQETDTLSRTINVAVNQIPVPSKQHKPFLVRDNRLFVPVDFFEHPSIQANTYEVDDEGIFYASLINHRTEVNIHTNWDYFKHKNSDGISDDGEIGEWKDASPIVAKGNLMVPLRTIAETLGLQVEWDITNKTVLLTTDKQYQVGLDPIEDWETWMGEKPMEEEDLSGVAITDDDIRHFFKQNDISAVDFKIVSKYAAVVLELDDSESSSVYALERLRNGELGTGLSIVSRADEEGVTVKRTNGFVAIAVLNSAKDREFEYCIVKTYDDNGEAVKEKFSFEKKQGILAPLNGEKTIGTVTFYGKKGFTHEVFFW
jgi:Copper amine oxidase N-terminal domain.